MLDFRLAKWSAVAPGLNSEQDWSKWLQNEFTPDNADNIKLSLKKIPPMLRRRFTSMGKVAAAALYELDPPENTPLVFASRHGDIDLTLSLLEGIAEDQAMSPTGFSLAVHNATAGLLSITRNDTAPITAVSACRDMLPLALLEAATQLQEFSQVICLICDTPIPDVYLPYTESSDIPYAIALLLSREEGLPLHLTQVPTAQTNQDVTFTPDYQPLLSLLLGKHHVTLNSQSCSSQWTLKRI